MALIGWGGWVFNRGRRATVLATGIATLAAALFVAPSARADTEYTPVRYSFDNDAPGSRPSGTTVQAGDFEVTSQIPAGAALRAKAKGGPWSVAAARFDRVIASRISVVWQETSVLGGDSHGFTLRHTEDVSGYLFLINGAAATYEPNTVGVYKVRNGTERKLASVPMVWSPRRSFIAEADGDMLSLYYSDTEPLAPGSIAWNRVISVHDYDDTITAGGLQYTAGWNGTDPTRTMIDDLTAFVLPVSGVVDLITPSTNQVVQRSLTGLTDVAISGGYAGQPTAIEARSGSGPWQVVDAAPDGGHFAGLLRNQATGQGSIEVRFVNDPAVTDRSDKVGVGDVFVIAGQSNAVGHGWANQPVSSPTFTAGMFGNDYRWKPLADPVDSPSGQLDEVSADGDAGGSVWPLVATKLMADQKVPVAFIPCGRNGTWIGQWQRDPNDPLGNQTLYGSMARRARGAGKIRAIVFWQGESDAFNGMGTEQYRSLLEQFAADVGRDLSAPVVVAQIGEGDMPAANLDPVRVAQRLTWDAGTTLAGPTLYDIHPVDDGVHFRTDTELATAAGRWWLSMRQGLYGLGDGRGPRLLSTGLAADRSSITVKLYDSSTIVGGTQGFSVTVAGSPVSIASVSRPTADTFVLNLGSPAGLGPVKVSLGKGHNGAAKAVPADDGGLPAELFIDVPVV